MPNQWLHYKNALHYFEKRRKTKSAHNSLCKCQVTMTGEGFSRSIPLTVTKLYSLIRFRIPRHCLCGFFFEIVDAYIAGNQHDLRYQYHLLRSFGQNRIGGSRPGDISVQCHRTGHYPGLGNRLWYTLLTGKLEFRKQVLQNWFGRSYSYPFSPFHVDLWRSK